MLCKSNYGFLECILLLVCSHAVHVFLWYISVVHCVYDQMFNLDCGLWLLILCMNTTTGGELTLFQSSIL